MPAQTPHKQSVSETKPAPRGASLSTTRQRSCAAPLGGPWRLHTCQSTSPHNGDGWVCAWAARPAGRIARMTGRSSRAAADGVHSQHRIGILIGEPSQGLDANISRQARAAGGLGRRREHFVASKGHLASLCGPALEDFGQEGRQDRLVSTDHIQSSRMPPMVVGAS